MAFILHDENFNYLLPSHGVIETVLSSNSSSVTYLSRSGLHVTVSGTNLLDGSDYNRAGRVQSIEFRDSGGAVLGAIAGLSMRADIVFKALIEGTGLPRIFWGDDELTGTVQHDVIEGFRGDDTLYGLDGDDLLGGGEGSDLIIPGAGHDTIFGGTGNDILLLEGSAGDWVFELAEEGFTATSTGAYGIKEATGVEFVRFADDPSTTIAVDTLEGIRSVAPGGGGLVIGTVGADQLLGSPGADELVGGGSEDIFVGGMGDDIYHASPGSEIRERRDAGYDHVNLLPDGPPEHIVYALPRNVESAASEGWQAAYSVELIGNFADNRLFGGALGDTLLGGAGNDELHGNDGSDILKGG
jgi:Ca2+-binding RTX toxin-like protein